MFGTREKLIELLTEMQTDGCKRSYVEWAGCKMKHEVTNEQIADHLIANGVIIKSDCEDCASQTTRCIDKLQGEITKLKKAKQWIPVTERLPELHTDDYEEPDGSRMQFDVSDDQWVITASGYQTKARYETGVVFQGWVGEYGETVRNVTHWMPLPEPPKEG